MKTDKQSTEMKTEKQRNSNVMKTDKHSTEMKTEKQ
jgi:hypothetical protein